MALAISEGMEKLTGANGSDEESSIMGCSNVNKLTSDSERGGVVTFVREHEDIVTLHQKYKKSV